MNNFTSNVPYNLRTAEKTPAFCVLTPRHAPYQADTPDWPIINGFRSDICANVKVEPNMVMLSLATAIAAVVQTIFDVERPNGLVGPCSLWGGTILEASGRKSTVDNIVNKPTRNFEARQRRKHVERDRTDHVTKLVLNAKKAGYLKAIQSSASESLFAAGDFSEIACYLDHAVSERIDQLLEIMPSDRQPLTFIMENLTQEGLWAQLSEPRSSKGIITPEGLNAFTGRFLQAQSSLNSIFSGDQVIVHRKSGPIYIIDDARISMSIMVQPKPFDSLINDKRKGKNLRDSGFASRFLFCRPISRQGTRFDNTGDQQWVFLRQYERRMGELLAEALQYYLNRDQPRKLLRFTKEAAEYWLKIYNAIELEMAPHGRFERCSDHAGKLPEIIARVAAVFHYFEGNKGDISISSLEYALRLCMHCSDTYLDIFDQPPQELSDANELNEWLNTHVRTKNIRFVLQNEIRQYGPNKLREKNRLNQALFTLHGYNCIQLISWGKKHYVDVFPTHYKDSNLLQYHFGNPK